MEKSASHLVLIPSYNAGDAILRTVIEARKYWNPVWVVDDGSTDNSMLHLKKMEKEDEGLTIIDRIINQGKGGAIYTGLIEAKKKGYTHVLTMDADEQHPPKMIPEFMQRSLGNPDHMILGYPIFDTDAPKLRVYGRRISNFLTIIETHGKIVDSLFGFRVYPVNDLKRIMDLYDSMRGFDFDPEVAVRLTWAGIKAINLPAPVRYLASEEGGISHFHYIRDNILLTKMHIRLLFLFFKQLILPRA